MRAVISSPSHLYLMSQNQFLQPCRGIEVHQPLQHFPATSPAPEKMNGSGKQVAANSIRQEPEQPSPLFNDTPKGHSCPKRQLGPTGNNQNPINSATGVVSRERKKEKHL